MMEVPASSSPAVTFIVPCYKLAHLLSECVTSILEQTFGDFEVLIMDDCSPDNTEEVARSFRDPRVRHIRNERNLGHLRNYNKGIELARGRYVWLISADDRLRRPYGLEKYVSILDAHPHAGFVCCSGVELRDGKETGIVAYSVQAESDTVYRGRTFLKKILASNTVLAAAVMVRTECYRRLGGFPLDLPFAGDWYLWCHFALHYDVAFIADALVTYRMHELSMSDTLAVSNVMQCVQDDVAVLWRVKREAAELSLASVVGECADAIALQYARQLKGRRYRTETVRITLEDCLRSIATFTSDQAEANSIRCRIFEALAEFHLRDEDRVNARRYYGTALCIQPLNTRIWLKAALCRSGRLGSGARHAISAVRSVLSYVS